MSTQRGRTPGGPSWAAALFLTACLSALMALSQPAMATAEGPELATAPAAGTTAAAPVEGDEEHEEPLEEVGEALGLATLCLLIATVCLSVFRKASRRRMLRWHKLLGYVTLISGLIHGTIMILH